VQRRDDVEEADGVAERPDLDAVVGSEALDCLDAELEVGQHGAARVVVVVARGFPLVAYGSRVGRLLARRRPGRRWP
jgi:hypothetical protein